MWRRWTGMFVGVAAAVATSAHARAQCAQETATLLPSEADSNHSFGSALAVDGETALVGAANISYVLSFDGQSWCEQQILVSPNYPTYPAGGYWDAFGSAAALSGDVAVVGAPNDASMCPDSGACSSGATHVFHRYGSTWIAAQVLGAELTSEGDAFGDAVAVFDDVIVVGAPGDDENGQNAGVAYVFRFDGTQWGLEQQLLPVDVVGGDHFGRAVAATSDTILVGAPHHGPPEANGGAVYVFEFNGMTWNHTQTLTGQDAQPSDRFGYSVAVEDGWAVVGAYEDDVSCPPESQFCGSGSAYVFNLIGTNWAEFQKLVPADSEPGASFGRSVAVRWPRVLVGAPLDDDDRGSAYVFEHTGTEWSQLTKLIPEQRGENAVFGLAVDLGQTAWVGQPGDDQLGSGSGSVSVFVLGVESPVVTEPPSAQSVASGQPLLLEVAACSVEPATFQWRRDGLPVVDDASISGATTAVLQIDPADGSHTGVYDVVVTNAHASTTSATAVVSVNPCVSEHQTISLEPLQSNDQFGGAVSVLGDLAIIGAPNRSGGGVALSLAFDGASWVQQQIFSATDVSSSDQFALSVASDGGLCVVGAPFEDEGASNSGAAYVFHFDGASWVQQQKLKAPVPYSNDEFGHSVAIAGNVVVVGAWKYDDATYDDGTVYVFRNNGDGWLLEQQLLSSAGAPFHDGTSKDHFGNAVAIDGDVIAVGAHGTDEVATDAGSVHVFRFDGSAWLLDEKLLPLDGMAADEFGTAVALSGDDLLVGGLGDNGVCSPPFNCQLGAVYAFSHDGAVWQQIQKLYSQAFGPWATTRFGFSIALSEGTAVIGAPGDHTGIAPTGSCEVWRRGCGGWIFDHRVIPSDSAARKYGTAVAVDGSQGLAGAPGLGTSGQIGAAYALSLDVPSPTIHVEPVSQSVVAGQAVSLSVGACGADVEFQWLKDGMPVGDGDGIVGATTRTLSFDSVQPAHAGSYRLVIQNVLGTVESESATLAVDSCTYFIEELVPAGNVVKHGYGWAVASSSNRVIVGEFSFNSSFPMPSPGRALVFECDAGSCSQTQELIASDGPTGWPWDRFGSAVAVDGDVALIGNYQANGGGAAYVFRFDGSAWIEEQKLLAPEAGVYEFGTSVGLSGDWAVVGAQQATYVFRYDGSAWLFEQKLSAVGSGQYRPAVAVHDARILVGSPGAGWPCTPYVCPSGVADLFEYDGFEWVLRQRLWPNDAAFGDKFGSSVALFGNQLLIGSPGSNASGASSGCAYVFESTDDGWLQRAKLVADAGQFDAYFGYAVALGGGIAMVAFRDEGHACGSDGPCGSYSARVFRFDGQGWNEHATLRTGIPQWGTPLGTPVAVSGSRGVLGGSAYVALTPGSAFVYGLMPSAATITQQPQPSSVPVQGAIVLTVMASDDEPLTYEWSRDGVALVNGGSVSGADTPQLTISPAALSDGGTYVAVVRDSCGPVVSQPAEVVVTTGVTIAQANPPADNPFAAGVQPFRDVLDTGSGPGLTAGIGAGGTPPQGPVSYGPISVTFSSTPQPPPAAVNVMITCSAGASCPAVVSVSGDGSGPYEVSLGGPIPPAACTTLSFAGVDSDQKLRYVSHPGNVNMNAVTDTADLMALIQALNNGSANLPANLARYNINRSSGPVPVNTQDLLRLVQLLNGTNTTQAFNGTSAAACPSG